MLRFLFLALFLTSPAYGWWHPTTTVASTTTTTTLPQLTCADIVSQALATCRQDCRLTCEAEGCATPEDVQRVTEECREAAEDGVARCTAACKAAADESCVPADPNGVMRGRRRCHKRRPVKGLPKVWRCRETRFYALDAFAPRHASTP